MGKRIFDIVVSLSGLLFLLPVFGIMAVWIKMDSDGPVFYRQLRVGKKGQDFRLYKFRSMYLDSDLCGLLTIGDFDPRITRSGYFIRKYKLDEFAQLINVLKGDMSLVGPRPQVRKYVNLYNIEQLKVLDIRPGLTDMASIRYRNESILLGSVENPEVYYIKKVMPDKLKLNLEYLKRQSFLFDLKLIILTLRVVIDENTNYKI